MVVFGGDENVGVERGDFLAPSLRVRLAVLMHPRWYRLIEERQLVILDVDNLKFRVLAAFQDIVHPLRNGRGFSSRSRMPTMIPIFSISLFILSGAVPKSICGLAQLGDHFRACSLLLLTLASCWSSFSAASSPSFLSDPYSCVFSLSERTDTRLSRSSACFSKDAVATSWPSGVSCTTRARRSLAVDFRTTSPIFSRRSMAAVMEPLA